MSSSSELKMYVVRRQSEWSSPEALQAAGARSADVRDNEMPSDIRWIRSYVIAELDGSLGTVCIYEASSPEQIREHASRVDMPADEILEVVDTVLVCPDPIKLTA